MSKHNFEDYLKRLPREHYQGQAYVHWSLSINDRNTGWLSPAFYYKFRELLTHTTFRYAITCPVYCCMPDHIHLLWIGLFENTDQLNAMKYFRRQVNEVLGKIGFSLQDQGYDNVLGEDDRIETAFEGVCEYIARNPERKGLVAADEFKKYRFTDCLIPGAPEVKFFHAGYWETFWRITSTSRMNGLHRTAKK